MFSKDFQDKVEHLDEFCKDKGFHAWFQTSAKEDTGIDEASKVSLQQRYVKAYCHGYFTYPSSYSF